MGVNWAVGKHVGFCLTLLSGSLFLGSSVGVVPLKCALLVILMAVGPRASRSSASFFLSLQEMQGNDKANQRRDCFQFHMGLQYSSSSLHSPIHSLNRLPFDHIQRSPLIPIIISSASNPFAVTLRKLYALDQPHLFWTVATRTPHPNPGGCYDNRIRSPSALGKHPAILALQLATLFQATPSDHIGTSVCVVLQSWSTRRQWITFTHQDIAIT